jgi:PAS domain S-box-containing protein
MRARGAPRGRERPPAALALVHELSVSQAELVRQAAELHALRARHAEVFEHSPLACVILDQAGTIVECNLAASTLLAVPRGLLIGKSLARFAAPGSREGLAHHVEMAFGRDGPVEQEVELRRADHAHLHVRARSARVGPEEGPCVVVAGLTDVTEATRLRAELARTRRVEAVGRIASAVAHDFNNLLMSIVGSADMALSELSAASPAGALVAEVKAAALRGAFLSGRLLSQPSVDPPQDTIDVAEAVERAEVLLRGVLGDRVALTLHLARRGDRVRLGEDDLDRVLLNLATNARRAMPGGGRLAIDVTWLELGADDVAVGRAIEAGRYVMLAVKDTGVGMDAATRERIFEPFFTRGRGKGTGLGLSTVRDLVVGAGGHVQVESAVGKGTTVRILLPCVPEPPLDGEAAADEAAADEAAADEVAAAQRASAGGSAPPELAPAQPPVAPQGAQGTVLLVEDDALSREALGVFLRARGYRVLAAGSSAEALRLCCGERAGPIDAVLVDVGLGQARGDLLVDDVLAVHPRAAVVFMSGRERSDEVVRRALRRRDATFLRKPFELEALAKALAASVQRR